MSRVKFTHPITRFSELCYSTEIHLAQSMASMGADHPVLNFVARMLRAFNQLCHPNAVAEAKSDMEEPRPFDYTSLRLF